MGKLVCLCNLVDEKEIVPVLKKGAATIDEIKKFTGAGTSCGRCHNEINSLIDLYQKKKPKDPQVKLDFGFDLH
jgi:bacterioferritin-associated ferredoxin